jgi:voltage-gated potassium channel
LFLFSAAAVVIGAIDVYITEQSHVDEGTRIKNIGDAFWWAMVTIPAVGYSDF